MVTIAQASQDERGKYNSGKAGDQTGNEVNSRTWYPYNWNVVLRPKNSSLAERIATNMLYAVANNCIGYDQYERNTLRTQYKRYGSIQGIKTNCECDCSSLVTTCIEASGVNVDSWYLGGNAPTTSTLRSKAKSSGLFEVLTESKYLTTDANLKRGDIILREGHHVIVALSNGANNVSKPQPQSKPNIIYKVKTSKGWLPEVVNNSDYAGIENKQVIGVMIKLSDGTPLKYRVHTNGKWYGWVTGYNANDYNNGYAGNDKTPIDAIEIKCDKFTILYNVSTTSSTGYCGEVSDDTTSGSNSYAGIFGRPIDKLICRMK